MVVYSDPTSRTTMLTSTKNPRIQYTRKLQRSARTRREEGFFVIEGVRLVEEAFNAGWNPDFLLYTKDINPRGQQIIQGLAASGVEAIPVSPSVMLAASDTQTPQGILAVLPMQDIPIPDEVGFILVLDGIRDPGNLGTILRSALAAGVEAVLLPPGNVDVYAPKVLRGAMGAHFKLAIHPMSWKEIQNFVKSLKLTCWLADSSGGQSYDQVDFKCPLALIIGGEAAGAGSKAQKLADSRVYIPMKAAVESLNVAVAAGVLVFEARRQRKFSPPGASPDL